MGWLRTLVGSGSALALSAALAQAADMPRTPLPLPSPSARPSLISTDSGWYLRGDIGAHWGTLTGAELVPSSTGLTDNHLGNAMTASLGVGIKSNWLRTDVTVDYTAPVKYRGTFAAPDDTSAKIQATTALFNGYLDLGTWYHITPYIGGGVGAAYARVSDVANTAVIFAGDTSKNQWNFAWAGMAGFAVPISHNMMVDVGYRYLNIGNVSSGIGPLGAMTFKNVGGHEVRVGVRWSFDELRTAR